MIAIYVRQSLDVKDSISIETQIDFCKKEITNNEEYTVFQDKGFSGKNTTRPAFQELLSEIENGNISKLIVYRLDRVSRSITDFANIIDFLEKYKVDFISANEKFDTSTPVGRAMLYIIMVFAQLERETIAERIKDNYYARGKTGVWLGGSAPLGFDIVNKTLNNKKISVLKPNKDISIVNEIFEQYANTPQSLGSIAKNLRNTYGGMWSNVKLSRILHNPIYVKSNSDIYRYYKSLGYILVNDLQEFDGEHGCMLYGKRDRGNNKYTSANEQVISIAKNKGIIEPDTFLICQNKLKNNTQIKNNGKGKHSFVTGLVKCGYCGYSMSVKLYNDKKYINCTGRQAVNNCIDDIATHYVEDVEEQIYLQLVDFKANLMLQKTDLKKQPNNSEINSLKLQLTDVEEQIESLINTIPQANDTLISYINNKILELDAQKKQIESKLNDLFVPTKTIDIPDLDNWDTMPLESKRNITHSLIDKVLVYNDEISIQWKY